MKTFSINLFLSSLVLSLLLISCGGEETVGPLPTDNTKDFMLSSVAGSNISGTVTMTELTDGSIEASIDLVGTPSGGSHPAHIHANTAAEGGGILLTFNPIDGSTGTSTTIFSALNDGTTVTFADLLDFDGYVNVHLSSDDLGTLVAQGDIGQNELTGASKSYVLEERAVAGISGTATFSERVNGEALATIELQNTPADGVHPAHIHMNSAASGGGILFTFTSIDGNTGVSNTNVSSLNDGSVFGYDDVMELDGYINVHLSADNLGTIVAQGDIGVNELTGESKSYTLSEVGGSGVSGEVIFEERISGEALATLSLTGTPADGDHPAHIHMNSAAETGGIVFTFNNVDGNTGMSKTHVSSLNDETAFLYADVLTYDGYVNIHLSPENLSVVAQGNIGSNEGVSTAIVYDVTNSGATAYVFNGNGLSNSQNPDITLQRGMTYTFNLNASGHPFFIKTAQNTGTGDAYDSGLANNGAATGTITFVVPQDAPSTLYYICQFHASMVGTITITD